METENDSNELLLASIFDDYHEYKQYELYEQYQIKKNILQSRADKLELGLGLENVNVAEKCELYGEYVIVLRDIYNLNITYSREKELLIKPRLTAEGLVCF